MSQYLEVVEGFEEPRFGAELCLALFGYARRIQLLQPLQEVVDVSDVVIECLPLTIVGIGRDRSV